MIKIEREIRGQKFSLETGILARQAEAAVFSSLNDTSVLCTLSVTPTEKSGINFVPLLVEYQERAYALGRIPGNLAKREGKPSEYEILNARMIDRALRPLFPSNYRYDTQLVLMVVSSDGSTHPIIPALLGASAVLNISCVPFSKLVSGTKFTILQDKSKLFNFTVGEEELFADVILAKSEGGITLCEVTARSIEEEELISIISEMESIIEEINSFQQEFISKVGIPEKLSLNNQTEEKKDKLRELIVKSTEGKLKEALFIATKKEQELKLNELHQEIVSFVQEEYRKKEEEIPSANEIKGILDEETRKLVRKSIIEDKIRTDGRKPDELREIECKVRLFEKLHGSALFVRGMTQALATVTLGYPRDERLLEEITTEKKSLNRFWVHYNFLPFSTGELRPLRAPSRREIGHGHLAARALFSLLPKKEDFLYTIRLVSDILESNGSTSMASVCGGSLALMDAAVPIKEHAAGISIGLVKEKEEYTLLTDITGLEDDFGDMDFKIAGTKNGITAIQLDTKIKDLTLDIIGSALSQAREVRHKILEIMNSTICKPRESISPYAPKVSIFYINPDKIKNLIGRGGKTIKEIADTTNAFIDIEDDGKVIVFAPTEQNLNQALDMIEYHTAEVEIGKVYKGRVLRVVRFGAFVEILPGVEGLVHISQLDTKYITSAEEVVKEGDIIKVLVIDIDEKGRISLSRKATLTQK